MAFEITTATLPGPSHATGICEDAIAVGGHDDCQIVAVSDGVGSVPNAALGAHVATHVAVRALERMQWDEAPDADELHRRCVAVLADVRLLFRLFEKFEADRGSLACTLICVVLTPEYLAAMQVGDGIIYVRRDDGAFEEFIEPQDKRYVNDVVSITHAKRDDVRVRVDRSAIDFVGVMTDGLERLASELNGEDGHNDLLTALRKLAVHSESQERISLLRRMLEITNVRDDQGVALMARRIAGGQP